jgi:hypothetical protein
VILAAREQAEKVRGEIIECLKPAQDAEVGMSVTSNFINDASFS